MKTRNDAGPGRLHHLPLRALADRVTQAVQSRDAHRLRGAIENFSASPDLPRVRRGIEEHRDRLLEAHAGLIRCAAEAAGRSILSTDPSATTWSQFLLRIRDAAARPWLLDPEWVGPGLKDVLSRWRVQDLQFPETGDMAPDERSGRSHVRMVPVRVKRSLRDAVADLECEVNAARATAATCPGLALDALLGLLRSTSLRGATDDGRGCSVSDVRRDADLWKLVSLLVPTEAAALKGRERLLRLPKGLLEPGDDAGLNVVDALWSQIKDALVAVPDAAGSGAGASAQAPRSATDGKRGRPRETKQEREDRIHMAVRTACGYLMDPEWIQQGGRGLSARRIAREVGVSHTTLLRNDDFKKSFDMVKRLADDAKLSAFRGTDGLTRDERRKYQGRE